MSSLFFALTRHCLLSREEWAALWTKRRLHIFLPICMRLSLELASTFIRLIDLLAPKGSLFFPLSNTIQECSISVARDPRPHLVYLAQIWAQGIAPNLFYAVVHRYFAAYGSKYKGDQSLSTSASTKVMQQRCHSSWRRRQPAFCLVRREVHDQWAWTMTLVPEMW